MHTRNPAATGFEEEERNFNGYYIHIIIFYIGIY